MPRGVHACECVHVRGCVCTLVPHWGRARAPESKEGLSGFIWEPEVAPPLELGSSEMREASFLSWVSSSQVPVMWGGPLLGLLGASRLRHLPQDLL